MKHAEVAEPEAPGQKKAGGGPGMLGVALPMPTAKTPFSVRKLLRWSVVTVGLAPGLFLASTLLVLATTLLTQFSVQLLADILSALQGQAANAGSIRTEAFVYTAIVVALIVMELGGRVLTGWSDTSMVMRLQQRLHDKVLALGAGFHDRHELGELSFIVLQSTGGAQQMLRELAGFPLLRGIPMVTALMLLAHNLATIQSVSLAAELAIGAALLALPVIGSMLAKRLQAAAGTSQQALADLNTEFVNSASQPLEVQVLGAQRQRSAAFAVRLRQAMAAKLATTIRLALATEFQAALPRVVEAAFLVYAVLLLVQTGSTATGPIIAIYYFVPQVLAPVQDLLGFGIGLSATWPVIAPVGELLDTPDAGASAGRGGATAVPGSSGGALLELDGVVLAYAGAPRHVLDGLSHSFAPGSVTAIVGRSGSGKSTILGVMNGLRAPDAGVVRLAGVPLASIDPEALRRRVATVSQFPLFMADTMRANFQLADAAATDAEIEAVCRKTGLWPVLTRGSLVAPLDAPMSRVAGQGLSGGERRLFAITRALLCRPSVLLLDEPTTGIDRLAVQRLAETLPPLLAGLTVIMVEHDMNFVSQLADVVCCLQDGRFVDVGSPAELATRPSLFTSLRSAQRTLADESMTIESVPLPSLTAAALPASPLKKREPA